MNELSATLSFPRLVPQKVHHEVLAQDYDGKEYFMYQRDCVENLVRNTFNLAFLCAEGDFRPGAEDIIEDTLVARYYRSLFPGDRIAPSIETSRAWLDTTIGFESFGVRYDQGGREALTGLDNILSLMDGMLHKYRSNPEEDDASAGNIAIAPIPPDSNTSMPTDKEMCQRRAARLVKLCEVLSTSTLRVSWNYNANVQNYGDVNLKFRYIHSGTKKLESKVKWLITKDHVCLRHGNELSC